MKCSEIIEVLEQLAPEKLACDWDNPGLLAGRSDKEVKTVFLAVDATDSVIDQAQKAGADLILTHHPLIFRPLKKVNDRDFISRRILRMIQSDISYYAMHTNFDAAPGCMADRAAAMLGLTDTKVLEPMGVLEDGRTYGIGLSGRLDGKKTVVELAEQVKQVFGIPHVSVYGDADSKECPVMAAICPGSGGSLIREAVESGASVYITGDIGHHDGIDAAAQGVTIIDAGHYGIEHIFMDIMEEYLQTRLGEKIRICRAADEFPSRMI